MLDIDNNQKPDNEFLSLKNEFVNLCDEFSAFTNYCACFCESVSLHSLNDMQMDKVCAHGLGRFAHSLRNRCQFFENWLKDLHVRM